MKLKHAIGTLVVAGLVGAGSAAQAEQGFEGALKDAQRDVKYARRMLNRVDTNDSRDLLKKLKKAEENLLEATITLRFISESVAGAKAAAAQGGEESVRTKAFAASSPSTFAVVQPSPSPSPAPGGSTKPVQPLGSGLM